MSGAIAPVTIRIMGKDFQVTCAEHEHDELLESAQLLNSKMKEIHDSRKVISTERIAVMAALNIAHELIQTKFQHGDGNTSASARIRGLQKKLASVLHTLN